ncbi:RNA polymerase sigma factor [Brevibacillus marinus]|uniref:RNA polymerase sigma factor n=1 Tax=Brevibacillus marinus TaxID=2496837 RepID=UPI003B96CF3E
MPLEKAGELTSSPPEQANQLEERDFTELYDEYFDRVNRYLRCRVANPWDADDLTTSVFLKALEKFDQYSRTSPFASWIFRIAHNTFIDYLRKNKETPVDSSELLAGEADETWQPERQALNNEAIQLLRERLEQLSPDQRDVLTLRYFADLKISQVAEVLGKSESSVKMLSYRGLKQLEKLYEEGDRREQR